MLFFALILASLSWAAERPLVLLTAFEPFGGSPVNGSEQVARLLGSLSGGRWEYEVCVLPVEYERAAAEAKKCFARLKRPPALVVSTGEAACDVRVEIRAHNLDDTPGFPDNGGLERKKHVIEPGAPFHAPLALPAAKMVCSVLGLPGPKARASVSPGFYVCNATAYRLARYFAPLGVRFGFVHLPMGKGCAGVKTEETARILDQMVGEALGFGERGRGFASCVGRVASETEALRKAWDDGRERAGK